MNMLATPSQWSFSVTLLLDFFICIFGLGVTHTCSQCLLQGLCSGIITCRATMGISAVSGMKPDGVCARQGPYLLCYCSKPVLSLFLLFVCFLFCFISNVSASLKYVSGRELYLIERWRNKCSYFVNSCPCWVIF